MQRQTNRSILAAKFQRRLRKAPTDAERRLWQRLRGCQLDNCKFRRQHPFGDYILDFVCLERGVVVGVDGGQHAQAVKEDAARDKQLRAAGFTVHIFWNNEVFEIRMEYSK